jgi:lysophospholipase L1-like esterase
LGDICETMLRPFLAAAILVAPAVGVSHAQTVTIDRDNRPITAEMQTLPVRVGGRVVAERIPAPLPAGATAYRHEWPGVYFEAAFHGESVVLKFDDPANEYRLHIDDLPPIALAQPGTAEVTVTGLADRPHRLRLEKVTESIGLPETFAGFYVSAGARPLAFAPPRARQIEFIGDSIMAGYGIRSTTRQCTKEEVRLLSDTQAAYPALVAKRFDADYQVIAISGRGLIRNYAGEAPEAPLPALYPRALPSQEGEWHNASWQPQIVVLGLFTNDFSTPLGPDEQWPSDEAFAEAFVAAYEPLLAELHRRAPEAAVLVVWPRTPGQPGRQTAAMSDAARQRIEAAARALGIRTILFPELGNLGLEDSACDYHGNLEDHRKRADWLTSYLEARPELWQGN